MTAYRIRVKGHLDPKFSAWFSDFAVIHTPNGDTLLTGVVIDQAALYGVVERCRDLGVTLISINPLPEEFKFAQVETQEQKEKIMNWILVEDSRVIDAPPEAVYAVISDYHIGHPAILPAAFSKLIVEEGGKGAGTVFRSSVTIWGTTSPMHALVSEPEPGHLLVETDIETGQYTNFIFEPVNGGTQTRMTFASEFPRPAGIQGFLMKLMMPSVVQKMYKEELQNLADYVGSKQAVLAS